MKLTISLKKEIKKKIEEMIVFCRTQVHEKDCRFDQSQCPKRCACRVGKKEVDLRSLDLDTAMYWNATEYLFELDRALHKRELFIEKLDIALDRIRVLVHVTDLHEIKYWKLRCTLTWMTTFLYHLEHYFRVGDRSFDMIIENCNKFDPRLMED